MKMNGNVVYEVDRFKYVRSIVQNEWWFRGKHKE